MEFAAGFLIALAIAVTGVGGGVITAPVLMLFHTSFLIHILTGNAVGWPPQARGDRGMAWQVALRRHIPHAVLGLVTLGVMAELTPQYLPWVLPVVIGLIFAAPVAVLSSRLKTGAIARRFGMFVTPEEKKDRGNT